MSFAGFAVTRGSLVTRAPGIGEIGQLQMA
jgi:hypothetical protein